jgi:hypothetical protein
MHYRKQQFDKPILSFRRAAASSNPPAAGKAGIASLLAVGHHWPGRPEPGRWAAALAGVESYVSFTIH